MTNKTKPKLNEVFAAVEELDTVERTVLNRAAQEGLANVAKPAQATNVEVSIKQLSNTSGMM